MKEKTKTIEVQGSYQGDHNKEMQSNMALGDYNKEHTIIKIGSFEEGSTKKSVIVGLWGCGEFTNKTYAKLPLMGLIR